MLSVICPVYNEEKYIDNCIQSILAQDYDKNDLEVLFIDGMSTDRTRNIIFSYVEQYPFIKMLDNPKRIVPTAMNIGIKASIGEIIIRLDGHVEYPNNYFSALVRRLIELDADNVGAMCKTDVLNKTAKTLAIKEVLCNRFGVGNSTFRLGGLSKAMEVDTVPFGCWKKDVFKRFGLFDDRLIRNQDIELNKRILRGGGKIFIVPDTFCTYYARETFRAIAKNNFNNGLWNILTVYYTGQANSLSVRHFIPLCFVLSIILPLLFAIFFPPIGYIALCSVALYLLCLIAICLQLSFRKNLNFFYLLWSFAALHISYGTGSLSAFYKIIFYKNKI